MNNSVRIKIDLGQRKDAKECIKLLSEVIQDKTGVKPDDESLWKMISKKVKRGRRWSETRYYLECTGEELSGDGIDIEQIMDDVYIKIIKKNTGGLFGLYDGHIYLTENENNICQISYRFGIDCGREMIIKQVEEVIAGKAEVATDTAKRQQLLYNFRLRKWEKPDAIGAAFIKGWSSDGFIDIDCKNENPEKVKDLLVRAISRLYARCSGTEYGGTNTKHDDYLRDEVERFICKPVIEGTKLHCDLWNTFDGPSYVYDEYGDEDQIGYYQGYNDDALTTYDHAFETFYRRSGDIDFVARTCVTGHIAEDLIEVFYTKNGRIHKIDQDDWAEPYFYLNDNIC